ncbi:MAG: arsenical pump-driving ATPase [Polyangiales bacterium]
MNPFVAPTRHLFFTGKGGVGKTALACAAAISLADRGKRVLLVSTDPASNLDEMLGAKLANQPTDVPGVATLQAMNIDPDAAAEAYRVRVIAPYVGKKSEDELRTIREQLSGACTTEIAAFDEFAGLIGGADSAGFDHVVFDTAPTGHTLRLLSLPLAWTRFLDSNTRGASCLGPHSGLTMHHDRFAAALNALSDPAQTTVVLVTRPDEACLREAERSSKELLALGIGNQQLVVNAVFHAQDPDDAVANAFERKGTSALERMPRGLRALSRFEVPLAGHDMVGIERLRGLLDESRSSAVSTLEERRPMPSLPPLAELIDELAKSEHALVMVMGKGGVGKTTIAAAIAVELANRGIPVHLSTTDPAAHLASTVASRVEHLQVSRIDPVAESKAYTDKVIQRKGRDLDEEGRALLEEDLRSPCTEEVAVFHAFSKLVSEAGRGVVVLDTAPTGHTLLLLDATGSYHRDVMRGFAPSGPSRLVTPLMRLRDPSYTKIILVTLAETTPVTEAAQLQSDLRRAGIEPFAWVIDSSLAASGTTDPLLRERAARELEQIERVRRDYAQRVAIVPWMTEPPIGPEWLARLARSQ